MDLIGPLPVTSRGNKYIITLTDYFSKWAEAFPLPDKTAAGVAQFMYSVSALCWIIHVSYVANGVDRFQIIYYYVYYSVCVDMAALRLLLLTREGSLSMR